MINQSKAFDKCFQKSMESNDEHTFGNAPSDPTTRARTKKSGILDLSYMAEAEETTNVVNI
jgi:hypothetical protein